MQYRCVHGIFEYVWCTFEYAFVYLNVHGIFEFARYIMHGILDVSKIGYIHFHYISFIIDSIKRIDGSRVAQISVVP